MTEMLCRGFCVYYKPGKNEELACGGYEVLLRVMEGGRRVSTPQKGALVPNSRSIQELKDALCSSCSFREADCDFILTGGMAPPCGGFSLLSHLLGSGEITIEEVRTCKPVSHGGTKDTEA